MKRELTSPGWLVSAAPQAEGSVRVTARVRQAHAGEKRNWVFMARSVVPTWFAGEKFCQLFQHLEALTAYWFFEHWEHLMDFMMRGQEVGPYAVQKS